MGVQAVEGSELGGGGGAKCPLFAPTSVNKYLSYMWDCVCKIKIPCPLEVIVTLHAHARAAGLCDWGWCPFIYTVCI